MIHEEQRQKLKKAIGHHYTGKVLKVLKKKDYQPTGKTLWNIDDQKCI